jgi:hypothetical protein
VLRRLAPVMVVMLVVLSACKGAAALTDPKEIITKGLEATTNLKSFHVSLALSGTFKAPGSGGSFKLDSTTLEADVDIPGKQAHLTFAVPAFLGLTGEVLVIGQDLYLKTSMTGDKWSHQTNSITGGSAAPSASLDTASMVKDVKDFLAKDGVVTKKLADVACGDRQCYQVSVSVPSSLMNDAGAVASMDPSTIFGDALVLNLLFDQEKLYLTEISTDVASDTVGTFSVTLRFSKFDESVTLTAPPSADVTEGELTLPGM